MSTQSSSRAFYDLVPTTGGFGRPDRGQVGIGTLIIFIAMILVAAVAAGVLINTAGLLQVQGEATGEESQSQVSDRLVVQSATGNVTDRQVRTVNLTVKKGAGSDTINLANTSYEIVRRNGVDTGILGDDDTEITNVSARTDDLFITDQTDRYKLTFVIENSNAYLNPSDSMTITLTPASGASTMVEVRVPDSVAGRDTVRLGL